ncbi:hypothetical protein [Cognatiluteimonas weifangensis]|uniref:hypothetical protein n=1 Tax=Cognatiluteimonas weifangensis TaxID=2303539 RepID=UPI0011C12AE9|nr:hypothetical protein [Luteimonas weifangensis]
MAHVLDSRGKKMRITQTTLAAATIGLLVAACGQTEPAPPVNRQGTTVAAAPAVPSTSSPPPAPSAPLGDLKVESIAEFGQALTLGPLIVFRQEGGYLSIQKRFHSRGNEIALVRNSEGGSGTIDSYFFVEFGPHLKPVVSEAFAAADGAEISPRQLADGIHVDLRFNEGMHEDLTYRNGKQLMKRTPLHSKVPGDEDTCNYLYNEIYVNYVRGGDCSKEFDEDLAMSSVRTYNAVSNDPRFSLDDFAEMSKSSCAARSPMAYSEFKKRVCGY